MRVIWANREAEYFCRQGWTDWFGRGAGDLPVGQISTRSRLSFRGAAIAANPESMPPLGDSRARDARPSARSSGFKREADQPQFQIGPIGVRVQHGPKVPPL